MKEILIYLGSIHPLSRRCKAHLERVVERKEFKKGDIILRIGEINENLYFIETGFLHCFYYINGKPVSDWFFWRGEFVVAIGSFYDQVPSEDCIIAMEDCVVYYMSKAEYDYTRRRYLEFGYIASELLAKYLKIFHGHTRFIRKHQVAERYQLLLQRMPDLVNRVPVAALATWLGMEPDTLSKIRSAEGNKPQNDPKKESFEALE